MDKKKSNNSNMNIIDILKRKISRKINDHVKHKASLKAFNGYTNSLEMIKLTQ